MLFYHEDTIYRTLDELYTMLDYGYNGSGWVYLVDMSEKEAEAELEQATESGDDEFVGAESFWSKPKNRDYERLIYR